MSLVDRKNIIADQFAKFSNWEERYKHIIALGKSIPDLPEEKKTEEAKVKGCQSQVWLHAHLDADGRIVFEGDSDALLVRGLVAMILKIYSGSTPEEILKTSADFLKDLGFEGNLTPSRANGLYSMLKQIHHFALAFQYLKNKQNKS